MNKILKAATSFPLSILIAATVSSQAQASIMGTSGAVNASINPPPTGTSFLEGETQSNRFIRAFDEQQEVFGFAPFILDVTDITPGNRIGRENPGDTFSFSPGLLTSGEINSHFLHFDPNQNQLSSPLNLTGEISFNEDIIGLILTSESLDGSDDEVGLDDVMYPTGVIDNTPNGPRNRRGMNLGNIAPDFIEFVEILDSRTLEVSLTARRSIDQIRVITSPDPDNIVISEIPEPSSALGLLLFGVLGAGGTILSKKKNEDLVKDSYKR